MFETAGLQTKRVSVRQVHYTAHKEVLGGEVEKVPKQERKFRSKPVD
jgi:hypothetical protein